MPQRHLERRLKLRMMRLIDAVDTHRSLLKASRALGVTQPALTRSLQEVEEILGGRVFDRHARGARLTPFGTVVCTAARRMLAEINRLDRDLDRLAAGGTGVVTLGALPPAAVGLLPSLLAQVRLRAPDIHVQLAQGHWEDLLPLLAEGELDMIMGRLHQPQAPDEIVREILYFEPFYIMARSGHPLFKKPSLEAADLRYYRFVLPVMSKRVEQEIETALSTLGLSDAVAFRSSSVAFLREFVQTSDNLTISPPLTMGADFQRGTICRIPFDVPGPPRPAGVALLRGRPLSHAARVFLDIMRAHSGDLSAAAHAKANISEPRAPAKKARRSPTPQRSRAPAKS